MATLKPTTAWQSRVLTSNELWQVQSGNVWLDTEVVEANRAGVNLVKGDSIQFVSGQTVYYRSLDKGNVTVNLITIA